MCEHGSREKEKCCFNCCKKEELVQDKLCIKFQVKKNDSQIIYSSNIDSRKLFASGTIENHNGSDLKVEFLLGSMHDGHPIIVEPGSTLAFTRTNFNAIKVTAVHHSSPWGGYDEEYEEQKDSQYNPGPPPSHEFTKGELCITPRYFV